MGERASLSGRVVGHFEVLERLGAGGFGEVYRARDTKLARDVAVKVLPGDALESEEGRKRFEREARALAALNHPGIAAIYSFEEIGGKHLIVMELVEGQTLDKRIASGPLALDEILSLALQIAEALAAAHAKGIVHRDLKPANVALTPRGQVKVLDFGIAKLAGRAGVETEAPTIERLTEEGAVFGTLSYMSPEQLLSRPLDGRSDLFSLGVVLYEMATGRLPFEGTSKIATADAILHAEPRSFADRPLPEKLSPIVRRLLQKDPEKRYASAETLRENLAKLEESLGPGRARGLSRGAWIGVAAAVVAVAVVAGWYWRKSSRERWALAQIPEITRLVEGEDFQKATALLDAARASFPNNPALENLWQRSSGDVSIETSPPGAEVSVRPFGSVESGSRILGVTPLSKAKLPKGVYVIRISKAGLAPLTFIDSLPVQEEFKLLPNTVVPDGMVPVPGGPVGLGFQGLLDTPKVVLDDFLMDRTEVTNEDYQKFVEANGYGKREYWKHAFVKDGRTVSFEEAVSSFRDSTGRPGPATWEAGTFPKGRERHPVAGVSWYEAAAYAEFAGKSLPTAYHWLWSAQTFFAGQIVPGSNFRGTDTVPVGATGALSGAGTYDMAGNVKEWCLNEGGGGRRFVLGGGFGEADYMFVESDEQSPWDRRPNYGLRCVRLTAAPPLNSTAKLVGIFRDFWKEKPVSDEVFAALRGHYAYDRGSLDARVEEIERAEEWTREKISFKAAYGDERVAVHLYLPKIGSPPFQTVVYFPGSGAIISKKFNDSSLWGNEFIVRGGRAFIFPIYKSTYERRDDLKSDTPAPNAFWRDHVIAWSKDLGRTLDYLQTRKDVDSSRMAYLGFSWGGEIAPIVLSVEDRFRAAILQSGGLMFQKALPEADPINFVGRVRLPVLMVNGRWDSAFPVETAQLPIFRRLGTPEKDRRHVLLDTGHQTFGKDFIRESLDWLDKYLGPVKR